MTEPGATPTLAPEDIQAIADAVTLQMLSLPRELQQVLAPNRTTVVALDMATDYPGAHGLQLRLQTDADGLFLEFTVQGGQRLAVLRFNYRGWAWVSEHRPATATTRRRRG